MKTNGDGHGVECDLRVEPLGNGFVRVTDDAGEVHRLHWPQALAYADMIRDAAAAEQQRAAAGVADDKPAGWMPTAQFHK